MSNAAADALARAREIAAKLSGAMGGSSELGKRKRWEEGDHPGLGAKKFEKVYIPVKDYPEINFLGLLIGPKGATQKQMQDATGAKILIRGRGASKDGAPSTTNHPDDNDDLHVHIEGSEEAVEKALKEVRSILFNPEQAMRLKNEQLQRLAEINNGGGSDSHYGPGGSEYQIEMRVPNNMVGLIIGRGGENIARIQSTLQVNVQIAKENEMKPGETLRSIVIRGTKENVDEAKLRIEDIIERDLKKNSMQGGGGGGGGGGGRELDHAFVVKLPVPNDKVGIIIGRGGMTIKGIQDRTKSYVQVPPQPDENDPNVRTLSIGADTKEAVDAAQMEIFMTFQSQQQSAANAYNASANAMQMLVPDDRVGIIIGKGGASIKEIQNRHRVRIQIPPTADIGTNPPMRTINIAGPVEGQQTAKYEIEMIVATNSLVNPATGGGGGLRGPSGGGNSADPYAAYGAYGAAAAAYGSYYDPYSAAAAYSAYYGAAAAGYSATAGTPTAAGAAAAAAAGTADVSAADLAAYHTAYWQYAAYYGEAAARMYYGAYSPPQGTPPPEGITLPTEEQIAANTAAATGQAAATTATATTAADASAAAATTTKESAAAASYDPAAAAAAAADATGGQAATTAQTATADAASADPAAATAAWEAYQKQYKEWYEAYGKAAGADPNPPAMT